MNQESQLIICALRKAVAGTEEALCLDVNWSDFLELAQAHMLLPLMYDGLHRDPGDWSRIPENVKKILTNAFLQAVCMDTRLDMVRQQLEQKLTQADIPYIFLKGAVLKHDYPTPAFRTMCDMDVLVHIADFSKIAAISESIGGKLIHSDGNHRNYGFPNGIAVEFHPNLIHQDAHVGSGINPGWQYAAADHPHKLTEEGCYLHTICHMAHHFAYGGVGVRFVLDVWVSCHLHKPQPDREKVEKELERLGLLEFTENIEALAEWWFGQGEGSPLLEELEAYILTSGSHGHTGRSMLNAVSLSTSGTGRSAILRRVFYSREDMEARFPWCSGKPWLLPLAWCVRAFRALTKHGNFVWEWGRGTMAVSKADAVKQKNKLARFGIRLNDK